MARSASTSKRMFAGLKPSPVSDFKLAIKPLPNAISSSVNRMPCSLTAEAAKTFPSACNSAKAAITLWNCSKSIKPCSSWLMRVMRIFEPACLNSRETTLRLSTVLTAKLTRVGGTSMPCQEPLIESLPPIAGILRFFMTSKAPKSAIKGNPMRSGSSLMLGKNSCKLRRTSWNLPVNAMVLTRDCKTA